MAGWATHVGGGFSGAFSFLLLSGLCAAPDSTVYSWVAARVLGCVSGVPNLEGLGARSLETEVCTANLGLRFGPRAMAGPNSHC